jgi:hypothetical protein
MQLNEKSFPQLTDRQVYDIECNIFNGSQLLFDLWNEFKGEELLVICAYNCGASVVSNGKVPLKTLKYANRVINQKNDYEKEFLKL